MNVDVPAPARLVPTDGVSLSPLVLLPVPTGIQSQRRPCAAYQDIRFASTARGLVCVQFQNFYAARVRVSQQTVDKPGQWQVVLRCFDLMADPHCEGDAQDWHTLTRSDVRSALVVSCGLCGG